MTDIRDNKYFRIVLLVALGFVKGAGFTCLALIWLACLASFGLYFYARSGLPLPEPDPMYQLGWILAMMGLSVHAATVLPPFSWLGRFVEVLWQKLSRKVASR